MAESGNNPSIIANDPTSKATEKLRAQADEQMKAELLRELPLEDIKRLVAIAKTGVVQAAQPKDEFDELGRNFARMVHRCPWVTAGGSNIVIERAFALTLEEARTKNIDYYDPIDETWIWQGKYRAKDYPENTVEYWEERWGKNSKEIASHVPS